MHSGRTKLTSIVVAAAGLCLAAANAYTIPRYSARYEQDCNLCHMNPTGGGQRTTYATQYIVPKEMSLLKLDEKTLASIDPQLNKVVSIGADARTVFLWSNLDQSQAPRPEDFFAMEGNLYVNLQMTNRFSLYFDKGISLSSTTPEIYGLGYILPTNGWVKVGRFVPDFGWHTPDHTAFVRQYMGFIPPGQTDVGIEAGVNPGNLVVTGAVLNGQLGQTGDLDNRVELAGRGLYRIHLAPAGLALGGSVLWNRQSTQEQTAWGAFGYVQLKPVTWTWEADFSKYQDLTTPTPEVTSFMTSHELAVQVRPGLDLKGTLDLYNPDVNENTGEWVRYGFGAESMVYPFVQLDAMVYLYRSIAEAGIDYPGSEYTQLVGQVHFFY